MFAKTEINNYGVQIDYVAVTVPASIGSKWSDIIDFMHDAYGLGGNDLIGSYTYTDQNGTFTALIPCTKPLTDEEFYGEPDYDAETYNFRY